MATSSAVWFDNPKMGQRVRLLVSPYETGGRRFVIESITRPFAGQYSVPLHFHPKADETFEILRGSCRYRVGKEDRTAAAGDTVVLPAGEVHLHPWSVSDEELHVRQTVEVAEPDLTGLVASIQGLITIFGLAREGKVNAKGMPSLLQIAVIINESMPATFVAGPPPWLQVLLIRPLAWLGRAMGLRNAYDRLGHVPKQGAAP